ncbi:MAG: prepilin peptidase [Candidatus Saccharimonadales bacterium]
MVVLILIILGLCAGSFVNAFVWRLHKRKDWVNERSVCVHCGHQLAANDLIPVLSWLWLRGKCRYCHKPISAQYPLVELLMTALFAGSYAYWPLIFNHRGTTLFVFWLIFLVAFVALAIYDLRWFLLPDKIVFPVIGLAVLQAVVLIIFGPPLKEILAIFFATLIGGGVFYVIFQLSQGKWIGGGDVKLGFLLGLVLADGGLMVLTIFLASLLGSLVTIPLIITGRADKKTRIPFGPFLIMAAIIARLFGAAIIHWYHHSLLLDA